MSQQRVTLVTGANKGIGFEVVKLLSAKFPQDIILLGTRDLNNGEQAIKQSGTPLSNVKLVQIDVTKADCIKAAVNKLESVYGRLDILINNSGIAINDETVNAANQMFDVNIRGVQRMNSACLPLLTKSAKPIVIIVGSELGSICTHWLTDEKLKQLLLSPEQWTNDTVNMLDKDCMASFDTTDTTQFSWATNPEHPAYKAYGLSKSIVNAYARYYAREHPEVRLALVCPGYCATDLNGFAGTRPASQGGESVIWPISNEFKSGQFYQDGKLLPFISKPNF